MEMNTVLDKKAFGVKDIVYVVGFVLALSGMYYKFDTRLTLLENDYSNIQKTVEENAKLTKAIYLGLVAKGIIKPPQ